MKRRKSIVAALGAAALTLVVASLAVGPLHERIVEEWCLWRLESGEPEARERAGKRLGELRSRRAVPILVKLSGERFAPWMLWALLRIGPEGEEAARRRILSEGPGEIQLRSAVAEMGDDHRLAIPFLTHILGDPNFGWTAATALSDCGPEGLESLLDSLAEGPAVARAQAAGAIGNHARTSGIPPPQLLKALGDPEEKVRLTVACALEDTAFSGNAKAIEALIPRLRDRSKKVLEASIDTLAVLDPEGSIAMPEILRILREEITTRRDRSTREYLFNWIVGPPTESEARLVALAEHGEPPVRVAAARALAGLRRAPDVAAPVLIDELKRSLEASEFSASVRRYAGSTLSPLLDRWIPLLGDEEPEIGALAALVLGVAQDDGDRLGPLFCSILSAKPGTYDWHWAASALCSRIKARGSVPCIKDLFADFKIPLRVSIVESLGRGPVPDPDAVEGLTIALGDPERTVRLAALEALSRMSTDAMAARPTLEEALLDPDPHYRLRAAHAIYRVTWYPGDTVPVLVEGLASPSLDVRRLALSLLEDMADDAKEALPALRALRASPAGETIRGEIDRAIGAIKN